MEAGPSGVGDGSLARCQGHGPDDEGRTHVHCECAEELQLRVDMLTAENGKLRAACHELQSKNDLLEPAQARIFSIERFKADDKMIAFFTGFLS